MSKRKSNTRRSYYDIEETNKQPFYKGVKANAAGSNVLPFNTYATHHKTTVTLLPKSDKQAEYIRLLLNKSKTVIFATGPAGTGKTMLAVTAAIKAFKHGECDKIVITRPAVEVDEEKHGFLPGTLNEKMAPWVRPIIDVMKDYFTPKDIQLMIEDETIEVSPLAFMRGRTFKNSWIIADEMQNATPGQLKMLLTRIGENSRIVVTGDTQQTDRKGSSNGLVDFQKRVSVLANLSFISSVEFTGEDIQRHPAVEEILRIYGDI